MKITLDLPDDMLVEVDDCARLSSLSREQTLVSFLIESLERNQLPLGKNWPPELTHAQAERLKQLQREPIARPKGAKALAWQWVVESLKRKGLAAISEDNELATITEKGLATLKTLDR